MTPPEQGKAAGLKSLAPSSIHYENLLDWALNAHCLEDRPTVTSRKQALLDDVNARFDTRYQQKHLNNWITGAKPLPRAIWNYLAWQLLDAEVGYDNPDLCHQLCRLLDLP